MNTQYNFVLIKEKEWKEILQNVDKMEGFGVLFFLYFLNILWAYTFKMKIGNESQ